MQLAKDIGKKIGVDHLIVRKVLRVAAYLDQGHDLEFYDEENLFFETVPPVILNTQRLSRDHFKVTL